MHGPVSESGPSPAVPLATWREWVGLGVLVLPALLIAIDMTVLHLAVPHLSADLKPTSTQLLWIIDIYGFFIAGSLVTMGALGDRIGRRKLLLMGAAAFSATSLVAAFSTSPSMLITARALLGVAAATLMPSTLSLIRNMFHDEKQRGFAIAVWISLMMGGGAAGPILGGIVLQYWWWGAVFLLNVPVMVVLLAVAPFLLPEYRKENPGRLDIASAVLATSAVMALVYGFKHCAIDGPTWDASAALAAGVLIGAAFVWRQQRLADPMINPELFRNAAFRATLATQTLIVLAVAAPFFLSSQYMQLVLGYTPLEAGLGLLPALIAGTAGSMLAPWAASRVRPALVIGGGLLLGAAGLALLTVAPATDGYPVILGGLSLNIVGGHAAITLLTNAILGAAPPERAGEASGLSETTLELANAVGIAVMGSLAAAIYQSTVALSLPIGLPDALAEAGRESLFAAAAAAAETGGPQAAAMLVAARDAFVAGLHAAAGIGAAILGVLAVLAVTVLRHATAKAADAMQH
ncbi:MFS transporter [Pedomonas sp. V897]|uniref:MFS transporter n=1 Tax=Pedomonas sp. V897 TaxID=3446482 RepID=UPI003EE0B8E1